MSAYVCDGNIYEYVSEHSGIRAWFASVHISVHMGL